MADTEVRDIAIYSCRRGHVHVAIPNDDGVGETCAVFSPEEADNFARMILDCAAVVRRDNEKAELLGTKIPPEDMLQ